MQPCPHALLQHVQVGRVLVLHLQLGLRRQLERGRPFRRVSPHLRISVRRLLCVLRRQSTRVALNGKLAILLLIAALDQRVPKGVRALLPALVAVAEQRGVGAARSGLLVLAALAVGHRGLLATSHLLRVRRHLAGLGLVAALLLLLLAALRLAQGRA